MLRQNATGSKRPNLKSLALKASGVTVDICLLVRLWRAHPVALATCAMPGHSSHGHVPTAGHHHGGLRCFSKDEDHGLLPDFEAVTVI
jgi:hypothetical protein